MSRHVHTGATQRESQGRATSGNVQPHMHSYPHVSDGKTRARFSSAVHRGMQDSKASTIGSSIHEANRSRVSLEHAKTWKL